MARTAVIYIDLLGVQNMWADGGAIPVKDRINDFREFVINAMQQIPSVLARENNYTVFTLADSISILCEDFEQAIGIGAYIFRQAFFCSKVRDNPFWI